MRNERQSIIGKAFSEQAVLGAFGNGTDVVFALNPAQRTLVQMVCFRNVEIAAEYENALADVGTYLDNGFGADYPAVNVAKNVGLKEILERMGVDEENVFVIEDCLQNP